MTGESDKHVLIIPSEPFLPEQNHLLGIFQYHQAKALRKNGWRVGVLSVSLAYTLPMFARALLMRIVGKRVGNTLDARSAAGIIRLCGRRLFRPAAFVGVTSVDDFPVVRTEGFYYLRPSPLTDNLGWIRAGIVGFEEYRRRFGSPGVIHAHNLNPAGLLAQRLAKDFGIPYVVTEHSTFYRRGLIPLAIHPALRRAAENASVVAGVSTALNDTLRKTLSLGNMPLRVIGNVLAPGFATALPLRPESSDFTFLSIGNLIPVKGQSTLLDAFADAFGGNSKVCLRIGGDGDLLASLKERASALGIASQVVFLGRLSPQRVVDEVDNCDSFVLPSYVETFGVVVIEALARGKPVIATRCGGPESIVSEDDGVLVPAGDAVALSAALNTMKEERSRFDSDRIRQRAIARFGDDEIGRQLVNMYADAMHIGES